MVRFIIMTRCEKNKVIYHLHSNMVRFIIELIIICKKAKSRIYIPIWLDLLYGENNTKRAHYHNLHFLYMLSKLFTFQYG